MSPRALNARTDYPLGINRPDLITTPTGKSIDDLTMAKVMNGEVAAADLRISSETLVMQADIAENAGRPQLGANFRRAAELTKLDDERVLGMYNALRPNASTKAELLAIADELEGDYHASTSAGLVREAADVYERRGLLRDESEG